MSKTKRETLEKILNKKILKTTETNIQGNLLKKKKMLKIIIKKSRICSSSGKNWLTVWMCPCFRALGMCIHKTNKIKKKIRTCLCHVLIFLIKQRRLLKSTTRTRIKMQLQNIVVNMNSMLKMYYNFLNHAQLFPVIRLNETVELNECEFYIHHPKMLYNVRSTYPKLFYVAT